MSNQKKGYAIPIAIMFALFGMIAFVTGFTNPLGVIAKIEFGGLFKGNEGLVSQLGTAANFLAYAIMGIPAGMMIKKIGYRKTAIAAVSVGLAGVGIQFLSGNMAYGAMGTFIVYLLGALISGFAMCMLNTVVNPMLNTMAGGGKKGNQLIQFGGVLNSTCATIVPILVGHLMGAKYAKAQAALEAFTTNGTPIPAESQLSFLDASLVMSIAMAIFALAFVVLSVTKLPEPVQETVSVKAKDNHSTFSFRHFKLGILAIFFYMGIEIGVPNFINLILTSKDFAAESGITDMNTTIAGSIVGTYWFLMLIGRLVGGLLGSKFSSRSQIMTVSSLAIVFVLLGMFLPLNTTGSMPVFTGTGFDIVQVPVGIIMLVLVGLCTSVMWGGIFNMAVEGLGKYTAVASGFFMVMVCGGGILPVLQGFVADATSYGTSYIIVLLCAAYILFYALVGSKNVNKDIKVD